jgi:hypothetical protein
VVLLYLVIDTPARLHQNEMQTTFLLGRTNKPVKRPSMATSIVFNAAKPCRRP